MIVIISFFGSHNHLRVVDFRSNWALSWGRPMSRFTRKARSRVSGLHDVGHEGVITGRDALSLRSSTADPQGVAHSPLQSTYIHDIFLINVIPHFW